MVNFTPFLVTSVCSAHHPPVKGVICPFTLPSAVLIPPPQQEWIYCSDAVDCFFFSSRVFLKAGHQVVVSNIYHSITFTLLYLLAHFPIAERKKTPFFFQTHFRIFQKHDNKIYTFAKHSFIINKSPFCIKTGMLQPWHFTGSQPKATTRIAKTGGNTLISLCKGDPSDNGETRMKKSSRPQKYLQVENNNKHV